MDRKVSVIIAAYNVEEYIDQCMESIFNQTYSNIEVVICDDCSTDGTYERLKKYADNPDVKVFRNKENTRQALSRNMCIENCTGDYILIQDADDISESDRIEKLMDAFEDGIDFVGSACYCFNEKEGSFENWVKKHEYPKSKDLLWDISFVHASILFKKECLQHVGGYRLTKHTKRGEDYDLILRLYAAGYRGKNIPDLLYGYRVNRNTVNRRSFKSRIDECFIRFEGFKSNHILFPFGWLFVFKPIVAFLYQIYKYRNKAR